MNDLSPQAKALLRAARPYDEPNDDDHRRVRSSVLARVGAGAAIGLAATMSTSTLAASTGTILGGTVAKIGIAVLLAGGLSTGAYFATHTHKEPAVEIAKAQTKAAQPVAPVEATPADDTAKSPATEAPAAPAARAKEPAAKGRAAVRPTGDIESEVRLLEQADAALRHGDAAGALAVLSEHASKFPSGALREERDGMNVVALCKAGRQSEGRAAADRFLSRNSKSALAARIRAACGIPRE